MGIYSAGDGCTISKELAFRQLRQSSAVLYSEVRSSVVQQKDTFVRRYPTSILAENVSRVDLPARSLLVGWLLSWQRVRYMPTTNVFVL
jgi:hypothetical protein